MEPLHFAFFSPVYLARSENFLYNQMCGMRGARVSVVAQRGMHLDEFPVEDIFLADGPPGAMGEKLQALRRKVFRGRRGAFRFHPSISRRIAGRLRESRPDLVYCLFAWNAMRMLDILDRVEPAPALVFLAGGTDITTAETKGGAYLRDLHQVFERSELILCGSRFLCGLALGLGAPPEKVVLHYIGVEVPGEDGVAAEGDGLRVLAVSRLEGVKGVLYAIRSFAEALAEVPGATLEIIGDGAERQACDELVAELGIGASVKFAGSQPLDVVHEAMRRSDIFIQHNMRTALGQEESIGGSILEASARGLPVVVTNSGGVSEGVVDGETGFVVAPGDVSAMAARIVELTRDAGLRRRMGRAGRVLMQEMFNLEIQNSRLEELLTGVAAPRRAVRG